MLLLQSLLTAQTPAGGAVLLEIKGAIGPATAEYLADGLAHARDTGASLVILEMDTPGGLDSAMRDMIKAILASDIPVATYVSPSGSRAASAGTYILYASHIAAMAPATNLGAATPVQIGSPGMPGPAGAPDNAGDEEASSDTEESDESGNTAAQPATTDGKTAMEKKSINDAVAYIRGLAELRGRNADWAERAVTGAESLSATAALEQNVIDLISESVADLLQDIDGRTIKIGGESVELATADLSLDRFEPDWRNKLLATITDPNVAYMLLLVGIYGLIFEGYNPGALVPGVVGAICLLIALFAFQILPVNYAGLALIVLGVALIIAEAFAPSFGALGLGGIAAFVFGSIILLDSEIPGFGISRTLIGGIAITFGGLLLGLVLYLVRAMRKPIVSGAEQMVGALGEALESFDDHGAVFVHGERWSARSAVPVRSGQKVRVTRIDGLELDVEPQE